MKKEYGRVGCIGRFKPLHLGAQGMLEALCENSEYLTIGIGSSNKYNLRNPFTPEETHGMIDAALYSNFANYSVVFVPDYGDGVLWRAHVVNAFKGSEVFVSGNKYVQELLKDDFKIVSAYDVAPDKSIEVNASYVRHQIASGNNVDGLVSPAVAAYLRDNRLIERFLKEFGPETLAHYAEKKRNDRLDLHDESRHTYEK